MLYERLNDLDDEYRVVRLDVDHDELEGWLTLAEPEAEKSPDTAHVLVESLTEYLVHR